MAKEEFTRANRNKTDMEDAVNKLMMRTKEPESPVDAQFIYGRPQGGIGNPGATITLTSNSLAPSVSYNAASLQGVG